VQTTLVSTFAILGAFFFLLAAIGVIRFPDLLMRMHAATKAGAFGGALLLIACAIHFGEWGVTIKTAVIMVFFYLTAPVASHVLARAGYWAGVPLTSRTHRDDLKARDA
jgi:multicomponent Na+:H+ antiporter subunit G